MTDHDLITRLVVDVSWIKLALFTLYPLIIANVGMNLIGYIKKKGG